MERSAAIVLRNGWVARAGPRVSRQHHVAAGGRRQRHRDQQDRWPRQHGHYGRVHAGRHQAAGRTDPAHSGQAREGGEEGQKVVPIKAKEEAA